MLAVKQDRKRGEVTQEMNEESERDERKSAEEKQKEKEGGSTTRENINGEIKKKKRKIKHHSKQTLPNHEVMRNPYQKKECRVCF